jgi:hypothetical protein
MGLNLDFHICPRMANQLGRASVPALAAARRTAFRGIMCGLWEPKKHRTAGESTYLAFISAGISTNKPIALKDAMNQTSGRPLTPETNSLRRVRYFSYCGDLGCGRDNRRTAFGSRQKQEMFLLSDTSILDPTQRPTEWIPRYFPLDQSGWGVRLITELRSAQVKNAWSCTSTQYMH